jgi:hypothetical protein
LLPHASDVPTIDIRELTAPRNDLDLPEYNPQTKTGVRLPKYSYRWIAKDNLESDLNTTGGGLWAIVNRNNHQHVPAHLFGATGAIVYKGQVVYCFTRKEYTEAMAKATVDSFNLKVTGNEAKMNKQYAGGKVVIEQIDGGSVNNETPAVELTNSEDYDYGDTGGE